MLRMSKTVIDVAYVAELARLELTDEEKNAISHRGKALRLMLEKLKDELK